MVIVLFAGLFILSILCWLWMDTLSEGHKRGLAKLVALLLMGAAFMCSAAADLIMIHASPRFEVTGRIQNLVQRHGKNDLSRFSIKQVDGGAMSVNSGYAGDHFQNGETVVAKVLVYRRTLLSLRVLDGRFSGWEHQEGDGSLGAWFRVAFGSVFVLGGIRQWRLYPNAPERPDYRTPANGIDTQSLLHLNED